MPAWMHERAEHILAKNPSMPKSEAFAIATQQSHALGKSPKGYGTAKGRAVAKKKYKTPEDDKKTAAWKDKLPGGLSDAKTPSDFSPGALRQGRKVESEHTKDRHLQTEISMDHLTEDPEYYDKLRKMEKKSMTLTEVRTRAFVDELAKIARACGQEKDSGFLDTVKNIALHDVGGPKGILQPVGQAVANAGKKIAPAAANATKRVAGGAYDVSAMARQMGM